MAKNRNALAILLADWHIRADTPLCRTDDYMKAQKAKIEFILNHAAILGIPIISAGDIGDKSQWPNWLLEMFMDAVLRDDRIVEIIELPGQHGLPEHNLRLWRKSGIGVLHASRAINLVGLDGQFSYDMGPFLLCAFPFGVEIKSFDWEMQDKPTIAVSHQLIIETVSTQEWQKSYSKAKALIRKHPEYDMILTGDNHHPFVVEYDGRKLVNPGSIMRMTADQIDHKPRIYTWYDDNSVEPIYLSIEEGVVTRDHIEKEHERDGRIDAYVEMLQADYEIGFSYEGNMVKRLQVSPVRKLVSKIIWECMDKGGGI